ncbi:MAG: MBL fold metallo-hydrolase, partial [Candidatus Promineifilaceae bacterium]|nr:MBL fold metallo-hydrolase [Candidatus Promineifilaceae bacterium]
MSATRPTDRPYALVLGIMQDGGLPHAGCRCPRCAAAQADPRHSQFVAALALVDPRRQPAAVWLIDATPDLPRQLNLLAQELGPHPRRAARLRQPDGLLLTHAHMGHTGGLVHLGPESMDVRQLPVYGPGRLLVQLGQMTLWQPLLRNLDLRPLPAGQPLALAADLTVRAVPVPHRDGVGGDTVAYHVSGPQRSLLYLPDIDAWSDWNEADV